MRLLLPAVLLLMCSTALAAPLFSDEERGRVMAYWRAPGRYRVSAPQGAVGPWQVRLTPEASLWFFAYNRARGAGKAPPTETPGTTSPQTADWEAWVQAKLAYDRSQAQTAGDNANAAYGAAKAANAATPSASIGPIPAALLAAVGDPPSFAAAVAPLEYTIAFDDSTVVYQDHVAVGSRYAYYRFAQGVMAIGTPLRKIPDAELDALFARAGMTPFEQHVARAVSRLEGGFESVNTYDTGFVSVGFIQFACLSQGGGSLGGVLLREKTDRPDDFERDFRRYGLDVNPDGLLVALDPDTGAELAGPDAARKIIDDKRLIAVFQHAGTKSEAFRIAQVQVAKAHYYPADDPITVTADGQTLTGKVSDVIKSEAGMATLFDRKVNTGTIAILSDAIAKTMAAHSLKTLADAAPYEREIVTAIKYRTDFLADKSLSQPP